MTQADRRDGTADYGIAVDLPKDLLDDLRAIAQLDVERVKQIAERLRGSSRIIDAEGVTEIVSDFAPDDQAKSIARAIVNISAHEKQNLLHRLENWRLSSTEHQESFPDTKMHAIALNLDLLIQEYAALRPLRKARQLLRDTGNELQSIIYVCDLRPVFDDERTEVMGLMPLVNLQIGYSKQNQDLDFFELTLTEEEVRIIVERGNDALKKLQVLTEMVQEKSDNNGNQ